MQTRKTSKTYYLALILGMTLVFGGIGWVFDMAWAGASIGLGAGLLRAARRMKPEVSS